MESMAIIKIIGAIASMSAIITVSTIYYSRKFLDTAIKYTAEQNQATTDKTSIAIIDLKTSFSQNTQNTREDYSRLVTHIDDRIDKIYTRIENNTQELKEYVAKEVSSLKAKDYDQDIKIEHTKDKLYGLSDELLKFKLEASEKYETKSVN